MTEDKIIAYLTGELAISQKEEFEKWLKEGNNIHFFNKVKYIWENSGTDFQGITADTKKSWAKINPENRRKPVFRKLLQLSNGFQRVAAGLIILFGLGFLLVKLFSPMDRELQWITEDTAADKIEITLADGSSVWLNANSSLNYPEKFKDTARIVHLQGEAYFEVIKHKRKPFLIYTNNTVTKVIGTSFNIKSLPESGKVVVNVAEGLVAFYEKTNPGNKVLLSVGDKGVYEVSSKQIGKQAGLNSNFLAWKTGRFSFENMPFSEVCSFLSEYYDVMFSLAGEELQEINLTAQFDNNSLDEVLTVLEMTTDVSFIKTGKQIRVERMK